MTLVRSFVFVLMWCGLVTNNAAADYDFITNAEVTANTPEFPPMQSRDWRTLTLPRAWSLDPLQDKHTHIAWYRIPVPEKVKDDSWDHILILRHMMNVELWLDSAFIGSAGPVSDTSAKILQRNWNRPTLWRIPTGASDNSQYLYIKLISEPSFGVMTPVIFGTAKSLVPWYRFSYFIQITLVQFSLLTVTLIGFLSLFVWIQTRRIRWLLLTLMSVAWAMPLLYIVLPRTGINEFFALRFVHWGVVTGATALLAFIYDYYFTPKPTHLKALSILPLLYAVLLALVPDNYIVDVGNFSQLFCQLLFVGMVVQLVRHPCGADPSVRFVIVGIIVMLLAALHDVTLFMSANTFRWRWDTPISYVTQPIMLIILAWQGIHRLLQSASQLAIANENLQKKLKASQHRIRETFVKQEALERELRIAAEREHVYRDLHDDLGARLLSLVYQSEAGRAQDLARTALQDLRDIVSRVIFDEQCLEAVLADCMSQQLQRAQTLKKDFDWEIDDTLAEVLCDSNTTFGLKLLLREWLGACLRSKEIASVKVLCQWQQEKSGLNIKLRIDGEFNQTWLNTMNSTPALRKRMTAMQATTSQTAERIDMFIAIKPIDCSLTTRKISV